MIGKKIKLTALAIGVPLMLSATSEAVLINGGIAINLSPSGSVSYDNTSLDFTGGAGNSRVVAATGDYASLIGSDATYYDFSFAPLMDTNASDGNPEPAEGVYIWDIMGDPGIHFVLTSVTGGVNALGILSLSGSGQAYMSGDEFDVSPGLWKLSADNTGSVFNFSSTTQVPDSGMTAGLLGMGLALVITVSRRARRKSAA